MDDPGARGRTFREGAASGLRRIYAAALSGYFLTDYGLPPHDYYEVFTTGGNAAQIKDLYGEHVDAIELHNLSLVLKPLCRRQLERIATENYRVTENIADLLSV